MKNLVTMNLTQNHFIQRILNSLGPVAWLGDRPICKSQIYGFFWTGAGPKPFFWFRAKVGVYRVPFDVVGDTVKGAVTLNGVSTKPILIHGASSDGPGVLSKADRMSGAEPMKALRDLLTGIALDEEVPVVWHYTERKEPKRKFFQHFL